MERSLALVPTPSATVLGIVGSYRKGGHIDTAVSAILASAATAGATTAKIYLQDQHIEFCTNCRQCLQAPGRSPCIHRDDMAALLDQIEAADALVLGAPVNFGDVNALTRRFLERTVCYGYWPWEAPAPTQQAQPVTKPAVLVTSSAAPALLGRWATGAMKTLRRLATMLGAKPIRTLWLGMVNPKDSHLPPRYQRLSRRLGQRLARG
ncbi:MAG: flavodoxin family protein [Leptolyngbya sp.]|nr:flavodoxin family protein [Leptolyngbya sp.]